MPVSAIDTLLQIATPPRTVEPPAPRPGGPSFGPALEKAYDAEKPRGSQPSTDEEPRETAIDEQLRSPSGKTVDSDDGSQERTDEAAAASDNEAADDETGEPEKDSSEDEVEISELASTVVASGEAQAAAAAEQDAAAAEILGPQVQGDAAGNSDSGEEGAASTDAAAETAEGENGVELAARVLSNDDETAEGAPTKGTKRQAKGKTEKVKSAIPAEAAGKPETDAKNEAAVQVVDQTAIDPELKIEAAEPTTSVDAGSEKGEPKAAKGEGGEPIKLPPIEQTAELAAAIERHVAQLEQSATGGEAAATNNAAPEAVGAAPPSQRTAATLDRLAAASLRRGENASSTEGGPAIDRPRFLQRVEGALRAAQQRDGRVQVRLAPPELGSLRIELSVQNGAMTAKLEAETPAARNALLDNLPALRDRLAEQNIRVEKFDVDIRRDSQGSGGGGNFPDQTGDRQEQGSQRRHNHAAQPQVKPPTPRATRPATGVSTDAGLDVRI